MKRRAGPLETVSVEVPDAAVEAYEAALGTVCATVGFFLVDEDLRTWRVEGVHDAGADDARLQDALAIAALVSGVNAALQRAATEAEGWLARTWESFPEQLVGRRFAVRGTHLGGAATPGRLVLTLDAGLAFGSGEHGSTRGCLRALEIAVRRRPRRVLDLGTGSGILAMAAAMLLRRRILASDIDPWSVRVTRQNAMANGVGSLVRPVLANGWHGRTLKAGAPYDLVLANILARPLCRMARDLAVRMAPGGTVVLAGLLIGQARMVLSAHRRQGLRLVRVLREGPWATLVLQKAARVPSAVVKPGRSG
ncbi:MAG: 50S ribosomal protein L11 methyltransferase [Gemmatimonadaceae bacterium]|nr:50S ribosomal protein L11 methyltransferase [Acetobacteraceae bacterium]